MNIYDEPVCRGELESRLPERKKFAVSLIIGFPAIAVVFSLVAWLVKHSWNPFFLWLGVIGLAAGIVLWLLPQIARPFYVVWYFIACCMGVVVGNLLFALFFYLVFTPLGLLLRMRRNGDSARASTSRGKATGATPKRRLI